MTNPFEPDPEESWENAQSLLRELYGMTASLPDPERRAERFALVADLKAYLQITYQETPDQAPRPKRKPASPKPDPDPGPRDYRLRDPGERRQPRRAAP